MPAGQSAVATMGVHASVRGVTYMLFRCLGKPVVQAQVAANVIAVKVAAAAGAVVAVVTVDPLGAAGSATYLGLSMGETHATVKELKQRVAQTRAGQCPEGH